MKHEWNPWIRENWSVLEAEWNNPALPMISIGVLNYNRRAELKQTLDVLTHAVQYPNYEIVVVDNGSTDGSIDMVRLEYPQVLLYEVGQNLGVSARNNMTHLSHGKYLFNFDDDTCPGTPAMILRIVQHMEKYLDIDALSTSYYQPITGLMETKGWEIYRFRGDGIKGLEGQYVVEGGICFRLDSLKKIEGYDPAWPGCEGMDLGLQLYKKSFSTYLCPWFLTLHFISPTMRVSGRRVYVNSRQMLWVIAKHWPILAAFPLVILVVLRRTIAMTMHPKVAKHNLRGLRDGISGLPRFLRYHPKLTWKQVWGLRRWYYGLMRWA
jgi:GT2 family glycosyltransferase